VLPQHLIRNCFGDGILPRGAFASAQSTGGRIRGTVIDPSGSAVPAANVTLINEANHATREVQTGANGEYVFWKCRWEITRSMPVAKGSRNIRERASSSI